MSSGDDFFCEDERLDCGCDAPDACQHFSAGAKVASLWWKARLEYNFTTPEVEHLNSVSTDIEGSTRSLLAPDSRKKTPAKQIIILRLPYGILPAIIRLYGPPDAYTGASRTAA